MEYERDVERRLTSSVKKLGGKCIKLSSANEEGLPDRMVLLPGGKIFFVELKRTTGILSVMQLYQHKIFRKLGQRVYVPKNKEAVDALLGEEAGDDL